MKTNFTILLSFLLIAFSCTFHQVTAQHIQFQKSKFYIAGLEIPYAVQQKDEETSSKSILDTLYSFLAPGPFPTGLVWDGQYFWNCDADSQMIYKLTTTGDVVTSFPLPNNATTGGGLEWDGNYLWLADEQSAILFKIDTTTGAAIEEFHLPSFGQPDPNGFGLAWDGQYLWHSEYSNTAMIYKLDPQNGQVLSSFIPHKSLILGITWANNFLYGVSIEIALSGGFVYKFEPSSGVVLDSAFWQVPHPLGLTWDGAHFWNASGPIPNGNRRIYQVTNDLTGIDTDFLIKPEKIILEQNYPNPFNPTTTIIYQIPELSFVTLKVYDMLGSETAILVNEEKSIGNYEVEFDASNLPSGIYFYKLQAGSFVETKKMILLR